MTSFTISSDGINAQRLKGDNRTPGTALAVSPVFASRGLHKSVGAPKSPQSLKVQQRIAKRRFTERRRRLDRRLRDRRVRDMPVLLDTRNYRERRTGFQRAVNQKERHDFTQHGIDVTV